jgi:hypothetical protein
MVSSSPCKPRRMNQTGIAASEETVSSCTRTDVFYCIGYDRTSNLPATRNPERLKAAIPSFHPLPVCDRVRQNSVYCNRVSFCCQNLPNGKLSGSPHSDQHPQPVHKPTTRIRAKGTVGKNSLLRLPGHPFIDGWIATRRAASRKRPFLF